MISETYLNEGKIVLIPEHGDEVLQLADYVEKIRQQKKVLINYDGEKLEVWLTAKKAEEFYESLPEESRIL